MDVLLKLCTVTSQVKLEEVKSKNRSVMPIATCNRLVVSRLVTTKGFTKVSLRSPVPDEQGELADVSSLAVAEIDLGNTCEEVREVLDACRSGCGHRKRHQDRN